MRSDVAAKYAKLIVFCLMVGQMLNAVMNGATFFPVDGTDPGQHFNNLLDSSIILGLLLAFGGFWHFHPPVTKVLSPGDQADLVKSLRNHKLWSFGLPCLFSKDYRAIPDVAADEIERLQNIVDTMQEMRFNVILNTVKLNDSDVEQEFSGLKN